jgi:uncharacterized protein (TIGR03086 family)
MGRAPDAGHGHPRHDADMASLDPDDTVLTLLTAGRDREAAERGTALSDPPIPTTTDGGPMDPLSQFAELAPVLGAVFAKLRPEDLDRPTPCAGFTVRGVLEHMIGGATAFAAAYRGDAAGTPELADPIAGVGSALSDLASSISAPGALARTIQAPFGEVDGESFARFVVLDGLVHGWDLATATGQPYDPPDELVAAVADFAEQTLDPLRDGETFAAAVEPPDEASPIERLAAYTGRSVAGGAR